VFVNKVKEGNNWLIYVAGEGLPDGIFTNKNPSLGKFWSDLQWKMLVYFIAIWSIIRQHGMFLRPISYSISIPRFGILYQEKSGNPVQGQAASGEKKC
jgi:hypothetical protein